MPYTSSANSAQSKLYPLPALIALDGALDKPHPAHAGHNARQSRRQRVRFIRAPRLERIGKFAIEHRERLEVTLGMPARQPRHGARLCRQIGPRGMPNFLAPIAMPKMQAVGIFLRPLKRCRLAVNAN